MRRSALFLAAALALPASAQQPSAIIDKFAVISINEVIGQSGHCRKMFAAVEVLGKQWQERLQAKGQEIQSKQQQLQASGLSEDGKDLLQKQIRDLQLEGQKMQEDAKAEVERAQQKSQDQLNQDVLPIVREVASEKGIGTVLTYQPGLFAVADEKAILAFSDEVAKRVDAKFPADAGYKDPNAPKATKPAGKK